MSSGADGDATVLVPVPANALSSRAAWRGVAVVSIWYALTTTTAICSPEILAALMKPAPHGLGLSVSSSGLLLTVEMIANGAFGLSARLFERVSSKTLVASGFLAAMLANLATTTATAFVTLMALRIIAGAGLGLVVIAASRFVAAAHDPDRLSSLMMVVSTVLNGAVLIVLGNASPSLGMVFGTLGGLAAVGLVTMSVRVGPYAEVAAVDQPKMAGEVTAAMAIIPGLLLIVATGLVNTADAGLYTLTSVVAARAGVDETTLGYILTGAMVAGVVAAVAAGWLRSARSRSYGLVVSILLKAAVALALVRATGTGSFGTMAVLYSVTYFYATPLLLGTSAHLDRRGRLAAQVSGAVQVGAALGPAWAASLDEISGSAAVATVCAVGLVAGATMCLWPLRMIRGDRG